MTTFYHHTENQDRGKTRNLVGSEMVGTTEYDHSYTFKEELISYSFKSSVNYDIPEI